MPIILSLSTQSANHDQLWAVGPEGLFRYLDGLPHTVAQPQHSPVCCLASEDRILVGGAPFGVAFSRDGGANWQAGWMDSVDARVVALVADPRVAETGVLLAASEGGGILRSADRGLTWSVCNFGLQNFQVLSLAWTPPAPAGVWPGWNIVLAGTEEGAYRSPNGGLGWKRSEGLQGAVLALAVAPDFTTSGVVLAGAEDTGLWRSTDGGRSYTPVASGPSTVNALAANTHGWLASDPAGLWSSADGFHWEALPDHKPALTLLATDNGFWAGGEEEVVLIY
jgi:hypothetical protein